MRGRADRGSVAARWPFEDALKEVTCPVDSGTWASAVNSREEPMAVASVTKITAASSEGFDAAVREGLARASKTVRGITGLHVIEHKASVENGKIDEYRVTMEVTFILEN
jgi:dodecin